MRLDYCDRSKSPTRPKCNAAAVAARLCYVLDGSGGLVGDVSQRCELVLVPQKKGARLWILLLTVHHRRAAGRR